MSAAFARHAGLVLLCALSAVMARIAPAATAYTPIVANMSDRTVTLTGRTLTIEEIVAVARHGAKVELGSEARRREATTTACCSRRLPKACRFTGSTAGGRTARDRHVRRRSDVLQESRVDRKDSDGGVSRRRVAGNRSGSGDEEIVRAMMVVRANAMTYNAPSPQLAQMLLDLLNKRITPVVQSRGTLGEGDLTPLGNVSAAMVGAATSI